MPQLHFGQFSRTIWMAGLALLFGIGVGLAQTQEKPRRVVSLNLCTDQLLLALADREQIASLSYLARDASISFLANEAAELPVNEGRAEAILFSGADLVLAGTYGQQSQTSLLKKQGLEVLILGEWTSLDEGQEQIRTLARRLGHPERGEALIADIQVALEKTRNIVPGKRSILVYERGGWVTGARSPLNEMLVHMGFTLHQEALGLPHGGMARLEAIVTSPPDFMLVDEDSDRSVDNGTALFVHPAMVTAVPLDRRLAIPGRLTICGGPSTPALIEALAREVQAKVR
jgi:iron complex transport system substrate-binding protein